MPLFPAWSAQKAPLWVKGCRKEGSGCWALSSSGAQEGGRVWMGPRGVGDGCDRGVPGVLEECGLEGQGPLGAEAFTYGLVSRLEGGSTC